jgi:hypothetical protein
VINPAPPTSAATALMSNTMGGACSMQRQEERRIPVHRTGDMGTAAFLLANRQNQSRRVRCLLDSCLLRYLSNTALFILLPCRVEAWRKGVARGVVTRVAVVLEAAMAA